MILHRLVTLVFLVSIADASLASSKCNFASQYNLLSITNDETTREQFLTEAAYWEGRFASHRRGINLYSGLTYDGIHVDYYTGEAIDESLHTFSAASKESVHVGLLASALDNNPIAISFVQGSADTNGFKGTWRDFAIDQLTRKIASYEDFDRRYPGFGGFIPWYGNSDTGMQLQWDWKNRVPSLDNGELVWTLVAAAQVLREQQITDLAQRYEAAVKRQVDNVLNVFWQSKGVNQTGLSCVVTIADTSAKPTPSNYQREGDCVLDDPYEGETMALLAYLFADWTNFGGSQARNQMWIDKRPKLVARDFASKLGPITVEQGWWYSSHEKWKYMMLPYTDVNIQRRVFLNGERARTHFSWMNDYPGLFAAVTNYSYPGKANTYNPDYLGGIGIGSIAHEPVTDNSIVTPYGSFPLFLDQSTRSFGAAWYATMINGTRMQGPFGSTEASSIQGDAISPTLTWDSKVTSVLAFCGGVTSQVRRYLQKTNTYNAFLDIIDREWTLVFATKLLGENIPMQLPSIALVNNGALFTTCYTAGGQSADAPRPCNAQHLGSQAEDSITCVCNATYCDDVPPTGTVSQDTVVRWTSAFTGARFARTTIPVSYNVGQQSQAATGGAVSITLDAAHPKQTMNGFGGAATDATTILIDSVPAGVRQQFINTYFSLDTGIGYSLLRVPIGACDFSDRAYSLDDTANDTTLSSFALQYEDLLHRIPFIVSAKAAAGGRQPRLVGSPWSAPAWMKTNGKIGGGQLLPNMMSVYAQYFVKYFNAYKQSGIDFWGVTVQNEPNITDDASFWYPAMWFSPELESVFVRDYLGPALRSDAVSRNLALLILDHNRDLIPDWPAAVLANATARSYVNGTAVHWYSDSGTKPSQLTALHNMYPDQFILYTEACEGLDVGVYGSWRKANDYGHSIFDAVSNWGTGWLEWNMAVNRVGGPSYVHNVVDASIVVDANDNVFYKQPMFYTMGHYSKWVQPGAQYIPYNATGAPASLFIAPFVNGNQRILVVQNSDNTTSYPITVTDGNRSFQFTVDPWSIQTLLWGFDSISLDPTNPGTPTGRRHQL